MRLLHVPPEVLESAEGGEAGAYGCRTDEQEQLQAGVPAWKVELLARDTHFADRQAGHVYRWQVVNRDAWARWLSAAGVAEV